MKSKNYTPVFYSCVHCQMVERTNNIDQHYHYHHQHIYPKPAKFEGTCTNCKIQIKGYERKTFCSRSCAASYNNRHSVPTRKYGPAPKDSLSKIERARAKRWTSNIDGPYSPLFNNVCKKCKDKSLGRYSRKYCISHSNLYSYNQRALYCFSFCLSDYPSLFNFALLEEYGMRSKSNPDGVVRDHRISVADAIKQNYDPYYIRHPINCKLMLHRDNSKKHTTSSITYDKLIEEVNEWDQLNPKFTQILSTSTSYESSMVTANCLINMATD